MSGELDPDAVAELLRASKIARIDVRVAGAVVEVQREEATVVVLAVSALQKAALHPYTEKFSMGHVGIVLVGPPPEEVLARMPERAVIATLHQIDAPHALYTTVDGTLERVELRIAAERRSRSIRRYRYELSELVEIARALTQERNIDRLLDLILEKSRFITGADAGSIYIVEPNAHGGEGRLRFKLSQNESVEFASGEFTIPISTRSIAGAAVVTRRAINIPDTYTIGPDQPFAFDHSFDERVGYRTKSMIAMPMISAEDEVIAVIQLINKKRMPEKRLATPEDVEREVIPFDPRSQDLLATLASQAGIALENALLYAEIRELFEGFVRASVSAIEQRDPTTSGHSLRVSVLSVKLAQVVDRADGRFRDVRFSPRDLTELEYAALLHDFGKIGVREQVLVKAKKLYPHELDQVRSRFAYARKAAEADVLGRKVAMMREGACASDLARLDEELALRFRELDEAWRVIAEANEPTVLKEGDFTRIAELGARTYLGPDGEPSLLLLPAEVESLQVTRGSLNAVEIGEIRSHVVHTHAFLSKIPWGKNFLRVPEIAGSHHEKLNGHGYPRGISADQIPIQSKIMAIADIYDALTARDRPYKRAVPVDRALAILGYEVKDGHIDGDLVKAFVEAEVYKEVDRELEY